MSLPEILEETQIHKRWLHIIRRKLMHPNGGIQEYEIVNPGAHSVCAVAFDRDGRVILLDIYRFAQHKRLLELPAGGVKPREPFEAAMRRELLEETGCEGELTKVGTHYIASEHGVTRHVFVAQNCVQVAQPQYDQSEIDEGAAVKRVTLDEFKAIVRSGQITETAGAFMVLDYLKML